jgi:glycosyltransferase involved in cell wall biosynthesis
MMATSSQKPILVSAIVPARDEEPSIAACVESLAVQSDIGEIVVIDDASNDRTAEIVRRQMQTFPQLRLLQTRQLPAGWVGKNYALSLGAREAKGQWLLFTDADAMHSRTSAAEALAIAAKENAVMVSFSPEQLMQTWYEKSLIPYVYCRLGKRFSFAGVNDPENPAAAANGQFLMIRRDIYEGVGGHAGVAGEVLEDVAFAKRVKSAGHRMWFGSGKGIVRVRMYRSFDAMWEGWRKNLCLLMGGTSGNVASELVRALLPVVTVLLATVFAGILTKSLFYATCSLLVILIGITFGYWRELRRNQFPGTLCWYAIPGRLLFAGVLWASYRSYRSGKLEWKGRTYPAGTLGASK